MPFFSVIVAARDAASTLPDTIASLRYQTFTDWEAIIVDDGSHDDTAAVARHHAERDPRIRFLSTGSCRGVSAARNAGIDSATGEWLLFLDADDSLFPDALTAWHRGILADRSIDVLCGRWVRVAPDGRVVMRERWPATRDMFRVFARLSAFPINSCVARRSLVGAAGGFDASFVTCEDWDLWQRLARAGARFGSIDDEVARYHMRRGSASLAARQMLADGLRVIDTGHARDPRVTAPVPQYENGFRDDDIAALRYAYACWPAGLVLGSGENAAPLLDEVGREPAPAIDPSVAAEALFRAATLPLCTGAEGWIQLWADVSRRLIGFLQALEWRTDARLLSRRILAALGRLILQSLPVNAPLTRVAHTMLHAVDVREPLQTVKAPADVERVVVRVQAGSEPLGFVHLPVCNGQVEAAVVADAIAFEYGWTILSLFFEAGVYREVVRRTRKDGPEAVRHSVVLGRACDEADWPARRHDLVGWTVFLQELWGRPALAAGTFYDPDAPEPRASTRTLDGDWITVDVLDEPVDWNVSFDAVNAELSIAGTPVCAVNVAADGRMIRSSRLRALLTVAAGVELVHVAVREGLIGRQWDDATLREHLVRRRRAPQTSNGEALLKDRIASPSARACAAAMIAAEPELGIVGARKFGPPGAATSRRASLSPAAHRDVVESAQAAGEPIIRGGLFPLWRVAYAPELIWDGAQQPLHVARDNRLSPDATPPAESSDAFGRHHFEALFASKPDPWKYTTPYEARKYEQTLSLIGLGSISRALEIGCAEGHFTEMLAPRVGTLLAADISGIAIERAAARCAAHPNVSFARLDLVCDALPAGNDLIVCSEVLYYTANADGLAAVAQKLRDALRDGGRLVTAHANSASDDPAGAGFRWEFPFGLRTIRDVLSETPGLQLTRELRTKLYSVLEFERSDQPRQPTVIAADFEMPEAAVAATICWEGGAAPLTPAPAGATLPILVYHQIADAGAGTAKTSRYRVAPDDFARQLAYLRDAGFRSASLAEWTQAILTRQPLGGRAVALTFDDAYEDFIQVAWPLLQHYGFGATLFVVSGHVGGENTWDRAMGEPVRLMDWVALRRVAAEGVEIGAHSATHAPMTGLTPADVVREASRARGDIQRNIHAPVTAFAYPYGDFDAVVEHLIGGCGFVTGVTCRPGSSALRDRPLRLPRIEIAGTDSLTDFIRKVGVR